MPNEDPGPCFIVLGIVAIVFDIVMLESTYLIFLGGCFIVIGIIASIASTKKTQKTIIAGKVQSHEQQQTVQLSPQKVHVFEEPPKVHKFCPHCGKNTTSVICPECGKKID